MSNNNINKKSGSKPARQSEAAVNRMMVFFVLSTAVVVALLLLVKSGKEYLFVLNIIPYLRAASGVLLALAVGYFLYNKKRGVNESGRTFNSTHYTILTFLFFAAAIIYPYAGSHKIIVAIIVLLVLNFVYCFYQRDFFWYSVFTVVGVLALYAVKGGMSAITWKNVLVIALEIIAVALPVIMLIMLPILKKGEGKLKIGKNNLTVMGRDWLYFPFAIGAAALLAGAVSGFFITVVALYAIMVLLALYLIFAIIYTVKMI